MNYFFFLEASMLICILGALISSLAKSQEKIRFITIYSSFFSALCAIASYLGFYFGYQGYIKLSEFNAPLPALSSLIYFVVLLCTPRTKFIGADKPFPSNLLLLSQALSLLICASSSNATLFLLLALEPLIPLINLVRRGEPIRIFLIHWIPAWLIAITLAFINNLSNEITSYLITILVIIRMGLFPGHAWFGYLTEKCSFTIALLFITPITPTLILLANNQLLQDTHASLYLSWFAIASTFYFAGLTLVQRSLRNFFTFLFLALSAMVVLGICSHETLQLTAAYSLRNSLWVALVGMGIIVRALEARHGRLSLFQNHGFYESTPMLGIAFLVCGLGCVGFPGTSAFISFEMLADEIIPSSPFFGMVMVFSEALISISLLMVYFKLFCGKKVEWSDIFKVRLREMIALWIIIFLIFGFRFLPLTDIITTHHTLEKNRTQQPH
jgi:hypothetical protein